MAESNSNKILDILKSPSVGSSVTASKEKKKNSETVALGNLYNFLVKDRAEKEKRQVELDRIQKQQSTEEFRTTSITESTPSAAPIKDKKDNGFLSPLSILGIISAGVGIYVFSDEIKQKIDEIQQYFEESTWTDAFEKFKELFDFSDLLDEMGLGPVAETVEKGAKISGFDEQGLNILTQGGKTMLSSEEFKQIQSQHKELEGKDFTDVEANIAAQGFKAQDIQKQLGTTDITQTFAAEKIGVEETKKLYAAKETESAAQLLPETAKSQRQLFYKDTGEERTVGEVRGLIASQARPPIRPASRLSSRRGAVSRKQVYDYIRSKGVGHNHAMGIMTNIEGESNFEPGRMGDNGTSGGLFQWHNERLTKMQRAIPDWQTNWKAQVDYALRDKEGFVDKYFSTDYRSPEEATDGWLHYFERSKNQVADSAKRRSFIPAIEQEISGDVSQSGLYSTQVPPPIQMTDTGSNISGLEFAPGVDNHISEAISGRMRSVQNIFGKKLTITSGYRDPSRNSKVGGAKNSAHLRGNAVDVSTNGMNTNDKIKLIQIASAVGIGGIGVYSNGGLHFDVEGRRAWGDDYHLSSLPQWAAGVIAGHLQGSYLGSMQDIQPIEQTTSMSGGVIPAPIPTRERKLSSGTNNTVIVNQQQAAVSIVKKQIDTSSQFKDASPQDIINFGIRGY